jgi:hypothetical protein
MTNLGQLTNDLVKKLKAALKSEKGIVELNRFIKTSIRTQEELLECLTAYCINFNGVIIQDESQRQRGLAAGYSLFYRSIELAGGLNDIGRLVPDMVKLEKAPGSISPQPLMYPLYLDRWQQLSAEDRRRLDQLADKKTREIKAGAVLISPLVAAYVREKEKVPDIQALFDYNPADDTSPETFNRVALECSLAWDKFSLRSLKASQLESGMKRLDKAFEAFRAYLKEKCSEPLVFFQVLKWIRDGAKLRGRVLIKGDRMETQSSKDPWSTIWHELYLEASYQAILFAVGKWNILSIINAKALEGQDRDFLLAAFTDPSEQLKLDTRLKWAFKNGPGFIETNRQRRRNEGFARYSNFKYVDEFETVEIQNLIENFKKQKPEYLKDTYAEIASNYAVISGNVRINQSFLDSFTIVWIKDGKDGKEIIIEFHNMPNLLYKTDEKELEFLIRDALWRYIAKISNAVIQFMLAYLEFIGLVVDVISAGSTGGFRRIAFEFIKQQMKDRVTTELLDAFHIENPAIRATVEVGANFLHVPKGRLNTKANRGTELDPTLKKQTPLLDKSAGKQLGDRFVDGRRALVDEPRVQKDLEDAIKAEKAAIAKYPSAKYKAGAAQSQAERMRKELAAGEEHLTIMHGTTDEGFRGLGGFEGGKIKVKHEQQQPGFTQDLGQGFYLTTDRRTAFEYSARRQQQRHAPDERESELLSKGITVDPDKGKPIKKGAPPTKVIAFDVRVQDLGDYVDIRPGGNFRSQWEAFLNTPLGPLPNSPTIRVHLLSNAETRGDFFEKFLHSINKEKADTIIAPLGDDVFTGVTAGYETTQVCIRSQRIADVLNAIMLRGMP